MEELHKQKILHLDLKAENFLVASSEKRGIEIKIADMGLSRKIKDGPIRYSCGTVRFLSLFTTQAHTHTHTHVHNDQINFMAPETVRGERNVWFWTDVWSLACVALEILSGKAPFYRKKRKHSSLLPQDLRTLFRQKITPLIHLAPKGAKQLFEEYDAFVQEGSTIHCEVYSSTCEKLFELLSLCFSFECEKRPSIRDLKKCVLDCHESLRIIRTSRFWHVRRVMKFKPSMEVLDQMIINEASESDIAEQSAFDLMNYKVGTIKFYNETSGFGAIVPDDGGNHVLFRKPYVEDGVCSSELEANVRVKFLEHHKSSPRHRLAFRVALFNTST